MDVTLPETNIATSEIVFFLDAMYVCDGLFSGVNFLAVRFLGRVNISAPSTPKAGFLQAQHSCYDPLLGAFRIGKMIIPGCSF